MAKTHKSTPEKEIAVKPATKIIIFVTNILSIIIPLLCFTIIPLISDLDFHILTEDKEKVNPKVVAYVVISAIFSIFVIIVNCYISTKDHHILSKKSYDDLWKRLDNAEADNLAFKSLFEAFNIMCDNKAHILQEVLKDTKSQINLHKGNIITKPQDQLFRIFNDYMRQHLMFIMDMNLSKLDCVAVSVAYKTISSDWKWLDGCEPPSDRQAQELAENTESAFFNLLQTPKRFIFYNSKYDEFQNKKYFSVDIEKENDGSLVGHRIIIGSSENPYAQMVVFFSTSENLLFVPDKNKDTIRNIKNKLNTWLFSSFDKRIKIELSLFFLNNFPFE